jgi:hypothetical protein
MLAPGAGAVDALARWNAPAIVPFAPVGTPESPPQPLDKPMPSSPRRLLCLAVIALAGCSSIGPATVQRDRLDYSQALAEAAKREILLNIVKLRYGDVPNLVSVSQLVAGYTVEGRVDLRSDFFREDFNFSDDVNFGIGGTFSDRPTVTYTPIKGEDFVRVMLTPIPPAELIAMLAAGTPADAVLGLGVQSINGRRNWTAEAQRDGRFDRAFDQILALLEGLRADGLLGFRFDVQPSGRTAYLLLDEEGGELDPRAARLLNLLGLNAAARSFPIRFGFGDGQPGEIRVYTRSLFEILGILGAQIRVPDDDVADGLTYPTRVSGADLEALPIVTVQAGELPPFGAFAAVEYRGTWFHVDNDDFRSKRVFSVLMLILNLVENIGGQQLPVITIPSG